MVKIKHETKQVYANQTTNVGDRPDIPNTGPRRDSASYYLGKMLWTDNQSHRTMTVLFTL